MSDEVPMCAQVAPYPTGHECVEDKGHTGPHRCSCGSMWRNGEDEDDEAVQR